MNLALASAKGAARDIWPGLLLASVIAIGVCVRSANATTCWPACDWMMPRPARITGRLASLMSEMAF